MFLEACLASSVTCEFSFSANLGTSPHQAFDCPCLHPGDSRGASEVPSGPCVFESVPFLAAALLLQCSFFTSPLFLTRLPSWAVALLLQVLILLCLLSM